MAVDDGRLTELEAFLARRFSCRAFRSDPVPRELIERILTCAQRTASWSNTQPWHVHLVSGEKLEAIRREFYARALDPTAAEPDIDWPREIRGVHLERRRACGWGLYEAVGISRGDRGASGKFSNENFRFFGAPHVALVTIDEAMGAYGALDVGAWVSNFMLCASAAGVKTVAQAALSRWPDIWRKHLQLAPERAVVCGVSFGFADAEAPANSFRTERAPISEVVTWVD